MASESVFERIAQGEHSAVRECMARHGGLVWSLARRFSETLADAEDATQEIYLELWKSAHRYRADSGSEAVFVATIARRRLIDRMRSSGRRPPMEALDEEVAARVGDEATDSGAVAVDFALAQRALAQLDPDQRDVVLMGAVAGMSHAEIAAATDKPLGTVKTQLRRGLARIRALMRQGEGPGPDA